MITEFLENLRQEEIKNQDEKCGEEYAEGFLYLNYPVRSMDILPNLSFVTFLKNNYDVIKYDMFFYNEEALPFEERMEYNNDYDNVSRYPELSGIEIKNAEDVNSFSFQCMKVLVDKFFFLTKKRWHIFVYDKVVILYLFGRDICGDDEWWVLTPKNGEPVNCSFFEGYSLT